MSDGFRPIGAPEEPERGAVVGAVEPPAPTDALAGYAADDDTPEAAPESTAGPTADAAHLDGIDAPTVAGEESADDDPELSEAAGPAPADLVSADDFATAFVGMFNMAGNATGLQSLKVDADERPRAVACAHELHALALRTRWLRWLIQAGDPTTRAIFVIGAFAVPKALAVKGEIAARRRVQAAAGKVAAAAARAPKAAPPPADNPFAGMGLPEAAA